MSAEAPSPDSALRAPLHVRFGAFTLDSRQRRVERDGVAIEVAPKQFDALLLLIENAGNLVSKEVFHARLWPTTVVSETSLNKCIWQLRQILGDSDDASPYIETVPKQGYRFVANVVTKSTVGASAPALSPPVIAHVAEDAGYAVNVVKPGMSTLRKNSRVREIVLACVGLIVFATAVWSWRTSHTSAPPTPITTIAVLPFKPLLPSNRDEALELGMADTLIAKLSRSKRVAVSSLNAVRKFGRIDQDPLVAGRELGVGAVLEGQLQRDGDHVRFTTRLLKVSDGSALWSGTFDDTFTNVFAMQDTIAEKAATALALRLDPGEQRALNRHYTENAAAYRLYIAARYTMAKATRSNIDKSIELFRQAIDLDPAYALAYAGLGEAYRRLPITSDVEPKEAFPLAKSAAVKALEIDDTIGEAHAVLGWVAVWYDWNWDAAGKEFRRAIEVNPDVAETHIGYALMLAQTGENADAIREAKRARALEPLSPLIRSLAAMFIEPEAALADLDKTLAISPTFWIAHLARGWLYLNAERFEDAITEFSKARDESEGSLQAVSMLGYTLARSGRKDEAQQVLDQLLVRAQQGYVPPVSIATVYAGLGDADEVFTWLNFACDVRDVRLAYLKTDRRWDTLRNDPRFVAIATRVGLQ